MYKFMFCLAAGAALTACQGGRLPADSRTAGSSPQTAVTPEIRVLSNRADLISGDDALVEVVAPAQAKAAGMALSVNGRDAATMMALRENGRYMGMLEGLAEGPNEVVVEVPGAGRYGMTITNHPIGGPVFSGPQIQPWTCAEGAIDMQCNREPTVEWYYMPSDGSGLAEYDPANPPSDVGTTTTDQGETVPYIVRHEIGTLNRDEYRFAVLWNPDQDWQPWAPQRGFNHKMVIFHGASCDTAYAQASAPDVLNETALGRGFVTMSHALDNAGHNCNIVVQGEALIMTKELVIERLGELRYTIGSGCSGGSLVQQQLANAYPGLYQGITPQCSFADAWSSALQYEDYVLLRHYLENPQTWAPGVVWDPLAIQAVIGHANPANPVTFTEVIPDSGEPTRDCPGLDPSLVYDENTNPDGVRCTFHDYMINVFGPRPGTPGFADVPWENAGVQYGLNGLMNGTLTPAQFVDLNARIGSFNIDHDFIPERLRANDFPIAAVYRSGAINVANNLDETAIIDLRGPDEGAFHDVYRTYVVRARLEREHGHADNQILWRGPITLLGDVTFVDDGILAMDEWLAAVEADTRDVPLARKIVEDRPASVDHRCTDGIGNDVPAQLCDTLVRSYSSPRIEAGMPFTDDVTKCQLKPLQRSDYFPIQFTDAQWAQLESAFPSGVCDYSQPGIGQQGTVPWMTYVDGPGGQPMGPAPRSKKL